MRNKPAFALAVVALVLALIAIAIRLYRGHGVEYFHVIFTLGLAAFVISLVQRDDPRQ